MEYGKIGHLKKVASNELLEMLDRAIAMIDRRLYKSTGRNLRVDEDRYRDD